MANAHLELLEFDCEVSVGETIEPIKQSVCSHYKRPSHFRLPNDFMRTPHKVKETFSTLEDGPLTDS